MSQCYISQQPLRDPVVACRLGNLYNKEAVINALLNKAMPKSLPHIKALKDVKVCQLSWADECDAVISYMSREQEKGQRRLVCPMTKEDLDAGGARAVVIWTSGAVVSAKVLKELKSKDCPVTGKAFDADQDVIQLAPDQDEFSKLYARLPAKKRKLGVDAEAASTAAGNTDKASKKAATTSAELAEPILKKSSKTADKVESSSAAATMTAVDDDLSDNPAMQWYGASGRFNDTERPDKFVTVVDEKKGKVYNALFTKARDAEGKCSYHAAGRDGFGMPVRSSLG